MSQQSGVFLFDFEMKSICEGVMNLVERILEGFEYEINWSIGQEGGVLEKIDSKCKNISLVGKLLLNSLTATETPFLKEEPDSGFIVV